MKRYNVVDPWDSEFLHVGNQQNATDYLRRKSDEKSRKRLIRGKRIEAILMGGAFMFMFIVMYLVYTGILD